MKNNGKNIISSWSSYLIRYSNQIEFWGLIIHPFFYEPSYGNAALSAIQISVPAVLADWDFKASKSITKVQIIQRCWLYSSITKTEYFPKNGWNIKWTYESKFTKFIIHKIYLACISGLTYYIMRYVQAKGSGER